MREWLTIIIVLLILGVLLDGWRRMRQSKRHSIRMNLKANKFDNKDLADNFTSELPNGGARVVGHRDLENARELTRHLQKSYGKKKKVTRPRASDTANLNLDEDVPLLMDSVEDDPRYQEPSLHHDDDDFEPEDILMTGARRDYARQESPERQSDRRFAPEPEYEPVQQQLLDEDDEDFGRDDHDSDAYESRRAYGKNAAAPRYPTKARDDEPEDSDDDDFDPANYDSADYDSADYDPNGFDPRGFEPEDAGRSGYDYSNGGRADDQRAGYDHSDDDHFGYDPEDAEEQGTHMAAAPETEYELEEVLVINVMSVGSDRFYGPDLLDVVFGCGMVHGDMAIFHRYEREDGEGHLLFSMANMVVPGTFDLDTIDDFETPGVSLFMTLPMRANSMEAFNIMADTAKAIASHLGGELKDEQRSVMTAQTLEHCRQRIREFERKQLSRG